jgi:GTP-binding protein
VKFFRSQSEFKIGATHPSHFPSGNTPEFAFIGRSNVGKSSLLNALVGRKNLARSSQEPGRIRQINFFLLGQKVFLVDLPGYGYAKAPKSQIRDWYDLIQFYLMKGNNLQRLFLLVDARHGIKPSDIEMLEFLHSCGVTVQIVLTKVDKLNFAERSAVHLKTEDVISKHLICMNKALVCSSKTKEGVEELQASIIEALGVQPSDL